MFAGHYPRSDQFACLMLRLECAKDPFNEKELSTLVLREVYYRRNSGAWRLATSRPLTSQSVDAGACLTHDLTIIVRRGRLADVVWNGDSLDEFVQDLDEQIKKEQQPLRWNGILGVGNYRGPCTFSECRFSWED